MTRLAPSQCLDTLAEVEPRNVLQQITLCSGAHAVADQLIIGERGQLGDHGIGSGPPEPAADVRSAEIGQVRVQEHHVRLSLTSRGDRMRASRGRADYLDLWIGTQQGEQADSNHLVVVHDEHTDRSERLVTQCASLDGKARTHAPQSRHPRLAEQ
jgi:hypothetical protein